MTERDPYVYVTDPYIYKIKKVVKVVDGDTIDAEFDLGFDISYTKRIRLSGIDTPESRTRDLEEKKLGLESKQWLVDKLEDAECILIKTEKPNSTEKFGRVLGRLYVNGVCLNDLIISEGYAWPYKGDTKVKDFEKLKIIRRQRGTLVE
jgi:micrococcal nuclease